MAADLRMRELEAEGERVVLRFTIDPGAKIPKKDVPQIFRIDYLERYEAERSAALAEGARSDQYPKPSPSHDFRAWSYKPRCPKCLARRVDVDVPSLEGVTVSVDSINAWPARCTIPGCGWEGWNGEVIRQCLKCGAERTLVVDGACLVCLGDTEGEVFEIVRLLGRRGWNVAGEGRYQYRHRKRELVDQDDPEKGTCEASRIVDLAVLASGGSLDVVEGALKDHEADIEGELAEAAEGEVAS